jgi:hypothetical protein
MAGIAMKAWSIFNTEDTEGAQRKFQNRDFARAAVSGQPPGNRATP